ncbi:MAG: GGDEF domain-containing protein [Xanthobacteraceae bacterium]
MTTTSFSTIALDISTLMVIAIAVTALLGLFLLAVWQQERVRALAWWGCAYLLGGFAISLWSIQGVAGFIPALANALLFVACGMIWSAARLFHGRPVAWVGMSAGAVIWLIAAASPMFAVPGTPRIVLSSIIISTYTFLAARELWFERRKSLLQSWPTSLIPVLHAAVFLLPAPLASLAENERGFIGLSSGWFALFVLEGILYVVGAAFIVVVLSKERSLRIEKNAAVTDALTGLPNRRAFFEGARKMKAGQARKGQSLAALMFDLDNFKSINDEYGHFVGDEVLLTFAVVLGTTLRGTDLVARFGGEEFVALLPATADEAAVAAERVRRAFEKAGSEVGPHPIGATVSVGVASAAATAEVPALLIAADAALYRAKAAGRNRVALAESEDGLLAVEVARAGADMQAAREILFANCSPHIAA